MGRRRRDDDLTGLIGPIAILLFLFGAAILTFLKALVVLVLIVGGVALVGFLIYRLGRHLWERQLDTQAYLPRIDWTSRSVPTFDGAWMAVRYPEFPSGSRPSPPHVIGTSGAWKDVIEKLKPFPTLRSASGPRELQQMISGCEGAVPDILRSALTHATKLAQRRQSELEQQVKQAQQVPKELEDRVRPQLNMLRDTIEVMYEGHFFERMKAERLSARLSDYEAQLSSRCYEAREKSKRYEEAVRNFLEPVHREQALQKRLQKDIEAMKEVVASSEFAGATAEVAVIDELSSLPTGSLVFNDVHLESGRYIHFEGKPLMSAQIDTLVLTPNGVFVIEVKNWSREFAKSGEAFSPYEQASRASYLVFDRLRSAGINVKVRAIIATNGSLPDKGNHKVSVVPIGRLRRYIENAPLSPVDISTVRATLGV